MPSKGPGTRQSRKTRHYMMSAPPLEQMIVALSMLRTPDGVHNETGFHPRTVAKVWELVTRWCDANPSSVRPSLEKFYLALQYHHLYPKYDDVCNTLGCHGLEDITKTYFVDNILPTLYIITMALNTNRDSIINWEDRKQGQFGAWNHYAHFDDCFTDEIASPL